MNISLNEFLFSLRVAYIKSEEGAEMLQEWLLATEHNFVIDFTAFKYYHFVIKWHILIGSSHLVAHCDETGVVHHVDLELGVQRERIVWILGVHGSTKAWHDLALVVIDVLIGFKQEVIEFLKNKN